MKEEAGCEAALSLCSGFLSCKQVLPSRAFHLQLCLGEAQERATDKGAWWTVSGPYLGRCQPCYLQHPFWLPSDTGCAEEGKCSAPTLSVLRNVVSRGKEPRAEAHQNNPVVFSSLWGTLYNAIKPLNSLPPNFKDFDQWHIGFTCPKWTWNLAMCFYLVKLVL